MTEKHYKVVCKVIMDYMESEEEALSATIESIRQNLENGELESCNLLKFCLLYTSPSPRD